jgi:SAM-dependent methyltransferase
MSTNAGVQATRPNVLIQRAANPNKDYYEAYWKNPSNRKKCRGENLSMAFASEVKPLPGKSIYDFGCGTGRGGLAVALLTGCDVVLVDITSNCLDSEVAQACKTQNGKIKFLEHDLFNPLPHRLKYGYAIDFFDKLGPDDLDNTLKNCLNSVERLYFTVTTNEERQFDWWVSYLKKCDVIIYLANIDGKEATFYTSCWIDAEELVKIGKVNIEDELKTNILVNIKKKVQQCRPYNKQEKEVILLAGGPSLNDFVEDIREKRNSGMALVTTNGTYNWAIEHGLTPSAQVIVDGREFNKRFLTPLLPECRYLLASQVHPSLFDDMPEDRTIMWHATIPDELNEELGREFNNVWYGVIGGSTVVLRSIVLMRMLGYYKFHIYGFDSCLINGSHHAYEQPENDSEQLVNVSLGDKNFICTTWMTSQAQEFMAQSQLMGDEVNLAVYGTGLIANILLAANQEK